MTAKSSSDSRTLVILNKRGLHARASAKFVTVADEFDATVLVSKDGTSVCGTSIMGLMMLAAAIGDEIVISGQGPEKDQLMDALEALVQDKFGEDD